MRTYSFASIACCAAVFMGACAHTGHLPAGPPPEYEETPLPTSASTAIPGDASLPTHPASEPPAPH